MFLTSAGDFAAVRISGVSARRELTVLGKMLGILAAAPGLLGPVVQKEVNANPGLKVNRGFCFSS